MSHPPIINYLIAHTQQLPSITASMYEYVLAGNGLFIRGQRFGLEATIRISNMPVRGLASISESVNFTLPRVPASILEQILALSRAASVGSLELKPAEILFHLYWDVSTNYWQLIVPEQRQSATSCEPIGSSIGVGSSYEQALIEVHSHAWMPAYFSSTDNNEESGKFRIFAVLGEIFTFPTIRVRLGLYEGFKEIPASLIFEMPSNLIDVTTYQ